MSKLEILSKPKTLSKPEILNKLGRHDKPPTNLNEGLGDYEYIVCGLDDVGGRLFGTK